MNSVFNHAIRNGKYEENPVKAIPTFTEPPGRDRFTTPEEILKFFSPEFKKQTVELIANELQSGFEGSTNSSTVIVSDLVQ